MPRESRAAQLDTLIDEAIASISVKDWDTAENKLTQAETILAFIPDMNRDASALRYRDSIDKLLRRIQMKRGARITTVKFRHCRPTDGTTPDTVDTGIAYTDSEGLAYTS